MSDHLYRRNGAHFSPATGREAEALILRYLLRRAEPRRRVLAALLRHEEKLREREKVEPQPGQMDLLGGGR